MPVGPCRPRISRNGGPDRRYLDQSSCTSLAALGEDGDGVVAIQALSVPSGGGGVAGDVGVVGFDGYWGGDVVGGVDVVGEWGAVVAGEPELSSSEGLDSELAVVVGVVVSAAEQDEVRQVG